MTGQGWMALVFLVMIGTSILLSALDKASEAKAKADRARWADDAIDRTGGAR